MSWSAITAAEVLQEFTPHEQASINAIQGATTQLAAILGRVVDKWRGAISRNQSLADGTTIPADCREEVIAEARWRWLISMPAMKAMQTKERAEANAEAKDLMNQIRDGQTVEGVDNSLSVRPSIVSRTLNMETDDQEGL